MTHFLVDLVLLSKELFTLATIRGLHFTLGLIVSHHRYCDKPLANKRNHRLYSLRLWRFCVRCDVTLEELSIGPRLASFCRPVMQNFARIQCGFETISSALLLLSRCKSTNNNAVLCSCQWLLWRFTCLAFGPASFSVVSGLFLTKSYLLLSRWSTSCHFLFIFSNYLTVPSHHELVHQSVWAWRLENTVSRLSKQTPLLRRYFSKLELLLRQLKGKSFRQQPGMLVLAAGQIDFLQPPFVAKSETIFPRSDPLQKLLRQVHNS